MTMQAGQSGSAPTGTAQAVAQQAAPAPAGQTVGTARFDTLLLCGVGLIGSSLARALRAARQAGRAGGAGEIIGADRDWPTLRRALALGIIDRAVLLGTPGSAIGAFVGVGPGVDAAAFDTGADEVIDAADAIARAIALGRTLAEVAATADVIVLCTPVTASAGLLREIAPVLRADAVLTDVGSTKLDICVAAARVLGARIGRFVPGHPVAGAANSGVDAGTADLFAGRDVIVCPSSETAPAAADVSKEKGDAAVVATLAAVATAQAGVPDTDAITRITALWHATGARVRHMAARTHDQVFASISHLPHLLAFAYIAHILETEDPAQRFALAGPGFRDFSRIAASSPEMWRDICVANREALLADMDAYMAVLSGVRDAIATGDRDTLETLFARARTARAGWQLGGGADTDAGSVSVASSADAGVRPLDHVARA